uniref:Uncharacterized protein n=1 Tax=Anguilla anguilla TaxID=7936 RepID=A0A0E9QIZ6_ANGAN
MQFIGQDIGVTFSIDSAGKVGEPMLCLC